jgi:hypothetical protein
MLAAARHRRPGTQMLVRYPDEVHRAGGLQRRHGRDRYQVELPDDQVHMFIVRAAMEKAVTAVREELGR